MNNILKKGVFYFFIFLNVVSTTGLCQDDSMGNLGKIDYLYLLRTNYVMMALLVLSLLSLAFIIERCLYFKSVKFSSREFMKKVEHMVLEKDFEGIVTMCEKKKNPLANSIKTVIENMDRSKQDLEEIYEIVRATEKEGLEKFMVILGSSAAISPLLGLLGTVTGIIKAFADLAASGSGGPSVVAAGVSEALVTTAFGLIVAIPVLLFFNSFNSKIKTVVTELDVNVRMLFFILEKK
ncbi:MotA/TolQ/ExbB proton channel family protein [bacterium]